MKNIIDEVYQDNKLGLFRQITIFICGLVICHLTDQLFAFLFSFMYFSMSLDNILRYLKKSSAQVTEVENSSQP
jgi:hypothetical protein